ncbi:MAG: ammonium transporter [Spirochaetaceae bacterium]
MKLFGNRKLVLLLIIGLVILTPAAAEGSSLSSLTIGLDTVWVLLGAFLVFFMQAGFGMVEAGFIRAKNSVNILTKNFLDFCMASIGFFIFGYAIMFGQGNGFMGWTGFALIGAESGADVPLFAFWLFQAAFCGAAATIVAGGMAERMKFKAYLIYSFLISAFVYPIIGHWVWGGGWLSTLNFADFAGSAVVHTTGGIAALVGTIILKPRTGKYRPDGSVKMIAGHNIPLASLGVFILWFGWFGFNAGSTLGVGDGSLISLVAINTNLAAAAGGIIAMVVVWIKSGKPDLSMALNGALAGLVAVTAPCAFISPVSAIIIGSIGGFLVVFASLLLDKLKIDDPVGAFPVHGVNGIWGALSIGLFGRESLGLTSDGLLFGGGFDVLGVQALGIVSIVAFVAVVMGLIFLIIDKTVGLRASVDEEYIGLDIGEHGLEAYSGFQIIE